MRMVNGVLVHDAMCAAALLRALGDEGDRATVIEIAILNICRDFRSQKTPLGSLKFTDETHFPYAP